jgi:drug/metabolite transporter (DMT)-like permease
MMSRNDGFAKGFLAVLAGAVAISGAAIFMRLSDVTPTAAAFWRVTLALPFLFVWFKLDPSTKNQRSGETPPKWVWPSFVVGFWFALDLFLWHWAVEETTVANATLLANMATIFTALAGFLFLGQRFSNKFLMGLGCALLGAIALVGQNARVSPEYLFGDILSLLTAIAYAGYIVSGAVVRGSLTTATVMFGTALTTSMFLLPVALMEEGAFFPTDLAGWWPLLGLSLLVHVLGQSLIIYGLAHVPAALGSVTLLLQPVISALLAWWLFAEALGLGHLTGAILIFAGIWLARGGSKKGNTQIKGRTVRPN